MKRFFALFTAIALCLALSVTAFAMPSDKKQCPPREFTEAQEKFQALSDKDKAAIYKLCNKLNGDREALIDAYEKAGVIDADDAAQLKTLLSESLKRSMDDGAIVPGSIPRVPQKKPAD